MDLLQTILGTDRKNPVFSVSQHSETKNYHVYYGLELFDVVPADREDIRFKLMVAHLHNVGVTQLKLQEVFGLDPRTIQNWSGALKSGDANRLARALAGRSAGRKLTRPVEHYVRLRFPAVYAFDRRNYSRKIRDELKELFEVELSSEALRPLFNQLKAELFPDRSSEKDGSDDSEKGNCESTSGMASAAEPAEQDGEPPSKVPLDQSPADPADPVPAAQPDKSAPEAPPAKQGKAVGFSGKLLEALNCERRSVISDRKQYADNIWCSHLGLLLFAQPLLALRTDLPSHASLAVCQWLSQVLLGAHNLEQTKLLSTSDLGLLLGENILGSPVHQRMQLAQLAQDPALVRAILRWNFARIEKLKPQPVDEFYFDPHVKQYTGQQNVLKGWCARIRFADKVINMDFAHSTTGQPVYLENCDNYDDMRQRFKGFEPRFRATLGIPAERTLTWTIDRGIFSSAIFEWVLESPGIHLITWEKGYQSGSWPVDKPADGSMKMERTRNHRDDLRTYHFEWIEEPWSKEPRLRRILVRATNPDANRIEVSILCDDPKRPANEIISRMFDRWVQENDFKYLDEHFGINEITSYQSETYAQIRGELEDREMKNVEYSALEKTRREQQQRLGKLLVMQKRCDAKDRRRNERIAQLSTKIQTETQATNPSQKKERKELGQIKGAQRSAENHRAQREKRIQTLEAEIQEMESKLENTSKEVSRLDTLIGRETVRLCGERKHLMDVIKITARNLFYEMLEPFKKAYNNFRDDHVWFRLLLQGAGILAQEKEGVVCHLVQQTELPKSVQKVGTALLEKLNALCLTHPDNSQRPIRFTFASKSAIQLAPQTTSPST